MDNSVRLKVRVKLDTIDGSAEADDDYIPVNMIWIEKIKLYNHQYVQLQWYKISLLPGLHKLWYVLIS